jgi:hypothetical protein
LKRLLSLFLSAVLTGTMLLLVTATPVFASYYGTCDSANPEAHYEPHVFRTGLHYWAVKAEIKNYHHAHACIGGSPTPPYAPLNISCPVNMQNGPANAVVQICIGAVRASGEHFWWTKDTILHPFTDKIASEPPIVDGGDYIFYIWSRTVGGVNYWHYRVDSLDSEGFATTYEFDVQRNNSTKYFEKAWWTVESYNAQSQFGASSADGGIRIDNLQYRYIGDDGLYTYATDAWSGWFGNISEGNVPSRWNITYSSDANHCFGIGECATYLKGWTSSY